MNSKKLSNNQKIVHAAALSSFGLILNYVEVPFFLLPYLKFDLSEVVVLIAVQISLPVAITVSFIKGILFFLLKSGDPIGSFALVVGSLTIAFSFYFLKSKFSEKLSLALIIPIFSIMMVLMNYFVLLPLYGFEEGTLTYILSATFLFNMIKASLVIIVYMYLNKHLKKYLG